MTTVPFILNLVPGLQDKHMGYPSESQRLGRFGLLEGKSLVLCLEMYHMLGHLGLEPQMGIDMQMNCRLAIPLGTEVLVLDLCSPEALLRRRGFETACLPDLRSVHPLVRDWDWLPLQERLGPGARVVLLRDLGRKFRKGSVVNVWSKETSGDLFYRVIPIMDVYPSDFNPWSQRWGRSVHCLDLDMVPSPSGNCSGTDNWSTLGHDGEIHYFGSQGSVISSLVHPVSHEMEP